jgi:hypothetical protein
MVKDHNGVLFEYDSPACLRVLNHAVEITAVDHRHWIIRALVKGEILKSVPFATRQEAITHALKVSYQMGRL